MSAVFVHPAVPTKVAMQMAADLRLQLVILGGRRLLVRRPDPHAIARALCRRWLK